MTPSVRSRLLASGTSFALGFAVANYGLLVVPSPDQWIWFLGAAVFAATGALGVLFADSGSRFSVWAVLGFEILLSFSLIPVAWAVSLALTPEDVSPLSIWPSYRTLDNFSAVLDSTAFRHAALNSLIVAGASTLIAVVLAVFAAHAIVHSAFRGRRAVYGLILGALLAPLVTLAGPMAGQALAFGLYDTKRSLVVCYLALTLPLALWLCVSLFSRLPRSLRDAARTEGATRLQVFRKVDLPVVGPGLAVVTLIVFFVAANDLVLGLALGATDNSLPVPATLTSFGSEFGSASAATAAAGLLWLLPALLFVLVFQRRIVWLLGRPNR